MKKILNCVPVLFCLLAGGMNLYADNVICDTIDKVSATDCFDSAMGPYGEFDTKGYTTSDNNTQATSKNTNSNVVSAEWVTSTYISDILKATGKCKVTIHGTASASHGSAFTCHLYDAALSD